MIEQTTNIIEQTTDMIEQTTDIIEQTTTGAIMHFLFWLINILFGVKQTEYGMKIISRPGLFKKDKPSTNLVIG